MSEALPRPREAGRYRLALVCLGNICRSPMAHVVLEQHLGDAGLLDRVEVRSAGTGGWHVGKPMDQRAAATLREADHDPSRHRAQQFDATWFGEVDLVLAMDTANLEDLHALLPVDADPARLGRFRDHDPDASDGDRDVPDPYYGGDDGFTLVLAMVERTCATLADRIAARLDDRGNGDD